MDHEGAHPPTPTGPVRASGHRRFIASSKTNLPQWPLLPPEIDTSGRGFILVGVGPNMGGITARWVAAAGATGHPRRHRLHEAVQVTDELLAWFDEALGSAAVGWRLMLAGPASEVLFLSARARQAGMIEPEIRAYAVEDEYARVQCVHCKTAFRAEAEPGLQVTCPGCGRSLLVHQHLSRRLAALLSFSAEAEAEQ